jgi:hypothetical protein
MRLRCVAAVRRSYPHSAWGRCHDPTGKQFSLECCESGEADLGFQVDRRHRHPDNAAVRNSLAYGEVAEIVIDRDENAPLGVRAFQDRAVTWICRPIPNPVYVVAGGPQCCTRWSPHAGIQ